MKLLYIAKTKPDSRLVRSLSQVWKNLRIVHNPSLLTEPEKALAFSKNFDEILLNASKWTAYKFCKVGIKPIFPIFKDNKIELRKINGLFLTHTNVSKNSLVGKRFCFLANCSPEKANDLLNKFKMKFNFEDNIDIEYFSSKLKLRHLVQNYSGFITYCPFDMLILLYNLTKAKSALIIYADPISRKFQKFETYSQYFKIIGSCYYENGKK